MASSPLNRGARLGSCEVLALLGEGGMGAVYRARDTKLGRDVAIKVLLPAVAGDAERLARFRREAQVLAALNHPHIAQIYGLEEGSSGPFLVMELVEGPTLADRIARGPIPAEEALAIVRQIAEALEAAHEQGIVHRDLKPANVKVSDEGRVTVLDFGLAKGPDTAPASGTPSLPNSPTITSPALMTGVGALLGTAAYMSPEQARGRKADKRSDVWALGCVLYEMLTGKRAFDGEEMADVLAAVVQLEPDWSAIPVAVPPAVRALLQACLAKDRLLRVADMSTVRFVLGNATNLTAAGPGAAGASRAYAWRRTAAASAAALLIGAAMAALFLRGASAPAPAERSTVQLSLLLSPDVTLGSGVNQLAPVVSPDGRRLAFTASRLGEPVRLWIRELDLPTARSLPGTENARGPFWSPDSRTLAFFANDKLKTIDAAGGPVQAAFDVPNAAGNPGGSWSRDGTIVFARRTGGLMKVAAAGGDPISATTVDGTGSDVSHALPSFLPDGRRFLYLSRPSNTLWLGTLDSSAAARLFTASSQVLYAEGHLLFARQDTLYAQPFDPERGLVTGNPTAIADGMAVDSTLGTAAFSSSETGALVYRTGAASPQTALTWVDRSGREIGRLGPVGAYRNPALSNRGTRVAVEVSDPENRTQDLYIVEAGGALSRFTVDRGNDIYPVWSPDDSRIAFGSNREGGTYRLYEKKANGAAAEELLLGSIDNNLNGPSDWSPDGKFLIFRDLSLRTFGTANLGIVALSGDRTPRLLFPPANFNRVHSQISPDGRWIAYSSRETGRNEVYVASFPMLQSKWPISKDGAAFPRWRGDGKELFYYAADGRITAVPVEGSSALEIGTPVPLFNARLLGGPTTVTGFLHQYDVAADGQRFLLNVPVDDAPTSPAITVVLNWAAGLRR